MVSIIYWIFTIYLPSDHLFTINYSPIGIPHYNIVRYYILCMIYYEYGLNAPIEAYMLYSLSESKISYVLSLLFSFNWFPSRVLDRVNSSAIIYDDVYGNICLL